MLHRYISKTLQKFRGKITGLFSPFFLTSRVTVQQVVIVPYDLIHSCRTRVYLKFQAWCQSCSMRCYIIQESNQLCYRKMWKSSVPKSCAAFLCDMGSFIPDIIKHSQVTHKGPMAPTSFCSTCCLGTAAALGELLVSAPSPLLHYRA